MWNVDREDGTIEDEPTFIPDQLSLNRNSLHPVSYFTEYEPARAFAESVLLERRAEHLLQIDGINQAIDKLDPEPEKRSKWFGCRYHEIAGIKPLVLNVGTGHNYKYEFKEGAKNENV